MGVEIPISPGQISEDDLVKVFRLFCEAHKTQPSENDEQFLRRVGKSAISSICGLEYHTALGATFKAQRTIKGTYFYGNGICGDGEAYDKRFRQSVQDYFQKK